MPSEAHRSTDDNSVHARLVRAADEEMRLRDQVTVSMAAVAERAGVSRATAFRQLGNSSEMVIQVGLLRARQHIERAREIMDAQRDIFAKMEDVMAYNSRELPQDPVIVALMAQRSVSVHHPDIYSVTSEISDSVLATGQAAGLIRTDVPIAEMTHFLVEQTYLAADYHDRSEEAARYRFRNFVAPALRPQPASTSFRDTDEPDLELDDALKDAAAAIANANEAAARLRTRLIASRHGIY